MTFRPITLFAAATLAALGVFSALPVAAADWSDTSIGWRYGTAFRESFVNRPANTASATALIALKRATARAASEFRRTVTIVPSDTGRLLCTCHQEAHLFRLPGAALEFPDDGPREQNE
jgi:hypothetical protein